MTSGGRLRALRALRATRLRFAPARRPPGHDRRQAAVLRQLAAERPYMDLDRVGAFGHSWGVYGALWALLLEPELYRVGVASAPAVDNVAGY